MSPKDKQRAEDKDTSETHSSPSADESSATPPKAGGKAGSRRRALPPETVEYLQGWMVEHVDHPYPSDNEKKKIMADTGIGLKQLKFWFVNNRRRYWRPMVDAWMKKTKQAKLSKVAATKPIAPRATPEAVALAQLQRAAAMNWTQSRLPVLPPPDISTMHPTYLWAYLATRDGTSHPPVW